MSSVDSSEDDLFIDALAEILNIGMGNAAASLSEMVEKEVILSAPVVQFVSRAYAAESISPKQGQILSGVSENFDGAFKGRAILLFPEPQSLELVRALLRNEALFLENLNETEQEAITEIGNIILNACLGSMANLLHLNIENNVPVFFSGQIEQILGWPETVRDERNLVLFLKMNFSIEQLAIQGYVTFLLDPVCITDLKKTVSVFLAA